MAASVPISQRVALTVVSALLGDDSPLNAVRVRGASDLGYDGWWCVTEDFGDDLPVGQSIFVVSPDGRVFEFGSIPPWAQGITATEVLAG